MKICLFFLCLLAAYASCAQHKGQHQDEILFEKGIALQNLLYEELGLDDVIEDEESDSGKVQFAKDIKENILGKAQDYYDELIKEYPKSKLLFRALNNDAYIDLALGDKEAARNKFKKILDSDARDKEAGGIGSGIMAEPYANYKNRAAKAVAMIYFEENNYKEAITYLDLTRKYPYQHFCGNEYAADEIYMALNYAKCYIGLRDTTKAMRYLLPNVFNYGLTNNEELVNLTYQTLLAQYGKDSLENMFNSAVAHYKIEPETKGRDAKVYLVFLGTEMEIPSYEFSYILKEDEKLAAIDTVIKKQRIYQLINN